jgi:hypothetical protein
VRVNGYRGHRLIFLLCAARYKIPDKQGYDEGEQFYLPVAGKKFLDIHTVQACGGGAA